MSRRGRIGAAACFSLAAACSDESPPLKNSFKNEQYRLGSSVAFLAPAENHIVRYDTQSRRLLEPVDVKGRIRVVKSGASGTAHDRAIDPSLAALTESEAGQEIVVVRGSTPDVPCTAAPAAVSDDHPCLARHPLAHRGYRDLRLAGGIAIAISGPIELPLDAAGGGGSTSVNAEIGPGGDGANLDTGGAPADVQLLMRIALLDIGRTRDSDRPPSPEELVISDAFDVSDVTMQRKGTDADADTWIALSGPRRALLVHALGRGSSFKRQGDPISIDLNGDRSGATSAPVAQFDRHTSRFFTWLPGTREVLWLDLNQAGTPLSHYGFDAIPSALTLTSTGGTEVVVALFPHGASGTSVGVLDPLGMRATQVDTALEVNGTVNLKRQEPASDSLLLFDRIPDSSATSFGVASAAGLASGLLAPSDLASDAITQVPVPAPYRFIDVIDERTLLVRFDDGSASTYNLLGGVFRALKNWTTNTRLITFSDQRIVTQTQAADGRWLLGTYTKEGVEQTPQRLPDPVITSLAMSETAFALVHPSAIGLLTYVEARRSPLASYTATGFLIQELAR